MATHGLKLTPEFFNAVSRKEKNFELRNNDRNFEVGDTLILNEWDTHYYTGWHITTKVLYILKDYVGLEPGYVILGIDTNNQILHWQDPK